jgi:hypothetical protein
MFAVDKSYHVDEINHMALFIFSWKSHSSEIGSKEGMNLKTRIIFVEMKMGGGGGVEIENGVNILLYSPLAHLNFVFVYRG